MKQRQQDSVNTCILLKNIIFNNFFHRIILRHLTLKNEKYQKKIR